MKYRYECLTQELQKDLRALADMFRDETKRVEGKFNMLNATIDKIQSETSDKLFNLQTIQKQLK